MFRRLLPVVLGIQMLLSLTAARPALVSAASKTPETTETEEQPPLTEDGTYAPGEVIVMFRSGAVKDAKMSLSKAQALDNVDENFGEAMEATGDADEAAMDAQSEAAILKSILGDDFVIRDSIAFDDDLTVALVSSDTYDTAAMIGKLSTDDRIASAEANYYKEPQSYDYTYSLNDPMNAYNYQTNTPLAHNEAGPDTSARGSRAEVPLSTNAGSVRLTDEEKEREVVVAVMDSGILAEHEDLRNMLWENPGDIGLEGEHGYNFYNNNTDLTPTFYHGTHVSGIIAAEAGNGVGIAGTAAASGANVKIMMVSTNSAGAQYETNDTYKELGAFNYILKAKKRGVNIVASSNSWSEPGGVSTIYDDIIDRLGEEGIVTFVAAGNYWNDLDNRGIETPASGDSKYRVSVGAADVSGEPASFTNFGKSKVDVFAPGLNVLSTVNYSCYFPNIYSPEKRNDTSEYYGLFDGGMVISTDSEGLSRVTPSKGDTGDEVKSFGASVFHAQRKQSYDGESGGSEDGDDSGENDESGGRGDSGENDESGGRDDSPAGDKATYTLSFDSSRVFTDSENPGSLKLTIHDADPGMDYYFYFPYEKNPLTTSDNTMFSIYVMNSLEDGDPGYNLTGGEVIVDADGNCELYGSGNGPQDPVDVHGLSDTHMCPFKEEEEGPLIISADELDASGAAVGIGICVSVLNDDEVGDIHIYLDSVAVSRPSPEIPERSAITPETSYDISSGTSMATPACAGAYAAYAACHPIREGQTEAEYALENRAGFLSCVTRTDALRDLCSTGGYIDLTRMGEENPVITDAVCDLENETLTICGERLAGGYSLRYIKLKDKDADEVSLPSGDMDVRFADDGKSIVIGNAKALFGTYIEFLLCDSGSDQVRASGSFFTVKGQKPLQEVSREVYSDPSDTPASYTKERKLFTDTKGQTLYGFAPDSGVVFKYDGNRFNALNGTDLKKAALSYMVKEKGFDEYDSAHNLSVSLKEIQDVLCTEDRLYHFVDVTCSQGSETVDGGEEEYHFLASLDFGADKPSWSFTEIEDLFEAFDMYIETPRFAAVDGKIYCFGARYWEGADTQLTHAVYCYDIRTGEWSGKEDLPAALDNEIVTVRDGKLYVMLGGGYTDGSDILMLSRKAYAFDGSEWSKLSDIPFDGRYQNESPGSEQGAVAEAVCAPVGNGFIFFNTTADGYGNTFLFDPDTGKGKPLYYTLNDFKADPLIEGSAVETRDGVYYLCRLEDEEVQFVLYFLPKSSGDYESSYGDEVGPEPAPAALPGLSLSSARLKAGDTLVLKASGGKVKKWTSSDPKTATVSKGIVKALKKGDAVISAGLDTGETLSCTVKVATSPELAEKSVTLKKGASKIIGIVGRAPGTNNDYRSTDIAEITSDRAVSSIKVHALKAGTTTLKVKVNGMWLDLKVVVK